MKFQYISSNKVLMMPIMIIMILLTTSNSNLSYSQSQSNGDSLTFEDPLSGAQFLYTDA
jgi:hypothetical protein